MNTIHFFSMIFLGLAILIAFLSIYGYESTHRMHQAQKGVKHLRK